MLQNNIGFLTMCKLDKIKQNEHFNFGVFVPRDLAHFSYVPSASAAEFQCTEMFFKTTGDSSISRHYE